MSNKPILNSLHIRILLLALIVTTIKCYAQENWGISVKEKQEIKNYLNSFEKKSFDQFLSEDIDFSANFYKMAERRRIGCAFIRNKEETDSPYHLIFHAYPIGFGGFSGVHLFYFNGDQAEHLNSTGLYTTVGNDIRPSIHRYDDLKHLGVEFHQIYHGNPETITPVMDYHRNLLTNFGSVPNKLVLEVLKSNVSGNRLVVQINEKQAQDVLDVMNSQQDINGIASSFLANWDKSIIYTDLTRDELEIYTMLQKKALNFITDISDILNWKTPEGKGYSFAYPIYLYTAIPPVPEFTQISKVFNEEYLAINDERSNVPYDADDNIFELIQKVRSALLDGVQVKIQNGQVIYKYSNTVVRAPKILDDTWPRVNYKLKEYQGEVDSDLLPHGKGTLKLEGNRFYVGEFINGLPHGLHHIYSDKNILFKKHFTNGNENGPYTIYDQYSSVKTSEGTIINGIKYPSKVYFYEVNEGMPTIGKDAKTPETLKFIKTFNYDLSKDEPILLNTTIKHAERIWKYSNGLSIAVNGNKAVLQYPNGDLLSGNYKYLEYENSRHYYSKGSGVFYGKCSYYSKSEDFLLEGECDKDKYDIKEGKVKIVVYDDVLKKVVRKSGKYRNGQVKYKKSTLVDVLFDEVFSFMKNGEIDFERIFFESINSASKSFENILKESGEALGNVANEIVFKPSKSILNESGKAIRNVTNEVVIKPTETIFKETTNFVEDVSDEIERGWENGTIQQLAILAVSYYIAGPAAFNFTMWERLGTTLAVNALVSGYLSVNSPVKEESEEAIKKALKEGEKIVAPVITNLTKAICNLSGVPEDSCNINFLVRIDISSVITAGLSDDYIQYYNYYRQTYKDAVEFINELPIHSNTHRKIVSTAQTELKGDPNLEGLIDGLNLFYNTMHFSSDLLISENLSDIEFDNISKLFNEARYDYEAFSQMFSNENLLIDSIEDPYLKAVLKEINQNNNGEYYLSTALVQNYLLKKEIIVQERAPAGLVSKVISGAILIGPILYLSYVTGTHMEAAIEQKLILQKLIKENPSEAWKYKVLELKLTAFYSNNSKDIAKEVAEKYSLYTLPSIGATIASKEQLVIKLYLGVMSGSSSKKEIEDIVKSLSADEIKKGYAKFLEELLKKK